GSAADSQFVTENVKVQLELAEVSEERTPTVARAAKFAQQYCYEYKDYLLTGLIVAGYDEQHGGRVFNVPIGGAMLRQPFTMGGSGSVFIYGYCDANYRPGMSKEECVDFVQTAIAHAMARDAASGGMIRLAIIDKDGVERRTHQGNQLPFSLDPPTKSS
ncbi:MAG: hypothetical protein MHM6MM_007800, partial [Cercozoa sp. M6MM]